MRTFISYLISVVVHIVALAAMGYYVTDHIRWELTLVKGKPIVSMFSAASISSEAPPTTIEADESETPQPTRPTDPLEEVEAIEVVMAKQPVAMALNDVKPEPPLNEPDDPKEKVDVTPARKAPTLEEVVLTDVEKTKPFVQKADVRKLEHDPALAPVPEEKLKDTKREDVSAREVTVVKTPVKTPLTKIQNRTPVKTPDQTKPKVDEKTHRRVLLPDEDVLEDVEPSKMIAKQPAKPVKNPQLVQSVAMPFQTSTHLGAEVDQLPRKLPYNLPPPYPQDALFARIQGRVVLAVVITSEGAVRNAIVETSSGYSSLDNAAIGAVRSWRFEPARRRGIAVEHEVLVPVNFTIRQG